MGQYRLLLIAADRLSAYSWRSGHLECEAEFAAEPQGFQSFAADFGQHRRSTFRLLALFAEEGYQREDIPFVRGRDRRALLARKLHQYYYGARLTLALSLGRETIGRRDEKLLLTALNCTEQLEPWLDLMTEAEARISCLYTLPLLATVLAANSARAAPLFLLLTLSAGGIHQTLFENARLRFSRLTPVATNNLEKIAAACATVSVRIYQYLVSQRVMANDDVLTTMVLIHPGRITQFRSHCKDTEEIHFIFADLIAEARQRGLKTLPGDSRSDYLFLHLMASKPPNAQFADAALRRFHTLDRTRLALRSTGMAIFLAGLLIAGKESHDYAVLREEALQMRFQIEGERQRYETALMRLPLLPTCLARLPYRVNSSKSATANAMIQTSLITGDNCPGSWSPMNDNWYRNWKNQLFYVLASSFSPGAATPSVCTDCLSVNGTGAYSAIVMFAGSRLAGQKRSSLADKAAIANYLEERNSTNHTKPGGNSDYQSGPATAGFNDILYCIDSNLAVAPCP